jgi:hypothetical protein
VKVCSRWVLILLFGQYYLNIITKLKAMTSVFLSAIDHYSPEMMVESMVWKHSTLPGKQFKTTVSIGKAVAASF